MAARSSRGRRARSRRAASGVRWARSECSRRAASARSGSGRSGSAVPERRRAGDARAGPSPREQERRGRDDRAGPPADRDSSADGSMSRRRRRPGSPVSPPASRPRRLTSEPRVAVRRGDPPAPRSAGGRLPALTLPAPCAGGRPMRRGIGDRPRGAAARPRLRDRPGCGSRRAGGSQAPGSRATPPTPALPASQPMRRALQRAAPPDRGDGADAAARSRATRRRGATEPDGVRAGRRSASAGEAERRQADARSGRLKRVAARTDIARGTPRAGWATAAAACSGVSRKSRSAAAGRRSVADRRWPADRPWSGRALGAGGRPGRGGAARSASAGDRRSARRGAGAAASWPVAGVGGVGTWSASRYATIELVALVDRRPVAHQPRNSSIRPSSRSRSASRPRWIRDLTVPSETPVISAISA